MRAFHVPAACALALILAPMAARGADAPGDARLRDALRSTTSQLRALEDEQARWLAKEATYQKELAALRADLAKAGRGAASQGEGRALKLKLAEQQEAAAKAAVALAECQRQAGEDGARAKKLEEERSEVTGQLDGLTSRANSCEARNTRMIGAGKDFATWLAKPGMVCEPVFGLRRVALENRTQEFLDKLLDQKAAR
jgi:chromosome segregation ATPase